jgi:cob(I)alamin adenosyltransferase
VGGARVPKDARRIAAYGAIDELNASLGLARVFNEERLAEGEGHQWLDDVLRRLQNELFDLGSELATPEDAVYEGMFRFSEQEVKALERLMDQCQKELEPLKSFILPGGGRIGGFLHQCRTICRRAERDILVLSREETINPCLLKYVNRLSDVFFVLARWVGKRLGEKEYLWERGLQPRPRTKRARS